jgi:hypothetical protein
VSAQTLTLPERVDALFASAMERTAGRPALATTHRALRRAHRRLQQPMRVAIVGLIKAGKSTLMNALLGEAVVATGAVEATFNVNWLCWGEQPGLVVHYKDDRPPQPKSFDELTALTLRPEEHSKELLSIRYIEVRHPSKVLQTLNLIDTPGLASAFEEDAKNTRDFLALHGAELTATTEAEAANADAVLYLFSRGLASADQDIVAEFLGPAVGRATPINAVGVLTKVDAYWSDDDEPLALGRRIAGRLAAHPQVRQLFYTIQPVCGLLAYGAKSLTNEEFGWLRQLAEVPEERLNGRIRDAVRFGEREYDYIPVPPAQRRQLMDRLGQYGVWLACGLLRGGVATKVDLTAALLARSGADELGRIIQGHFGGRAYAIKLQTALRQVEQVCFRERLGLAGGDRQLLDTIAGEFEALESSAHAFEELRVLRDCYEGKLDLEPDELAQLLAVTGEHGTSCARRLGLDEEPAVDELHIARLLLIAQERRAAWHLRATDDIGTDRTTLAAAAVIARSYERVIHHLNTAQQHLRAAQWHLGLEGIA